MPAELDLSVVIPTYNRAAGLPPLLERLLDQDAGDIRYDILVVDNNSSDDTAAVVQRAMARDGSGRLRYVREPRQGVSYARNTGIEQTTAPLVLFLDDDGVPARDWVRSMRAAFADHPEADCIGGRVAARWTVPPPSWMEQAHTGPIAIQDWPAPVVVDATNAGPCLITANIGFRRSVFDRVGGFSPEYPRNQDRELQLRMWRAGLRGIYLPQCEVIVDVPAERLTAHYHRRWRATTGKYQAKMRFIDSLTPDGALRDASHRTRTILGVPLFVYRAALMHLAKWVRAALLLRADRRFFHETRLWFYAGFILQRWRDATRRTPARVARATS